LAIRISDYGLTEELSHGAWTLIKFANPPSAFRMYIFGERGELVMWYASRLAPMLVVPFSITTFPVT
jgi:hypothetical protein